MNWWHVVLSLALVAALGVVVGVAIGTERRNQLRDERDAAYDRGWDHCAEATGRADDHLAAVLSTGRGAADDGPAPLPAPPMIDPDCRDGKHGSCVGGPCECFCHDGPPNVEEIADDQWADTLATMRRELAADDERPATRTDQFRAIFSRADGLERECLLTWNDARRFERSRPAHLREMGISEKRIRELLGAE